MLNETLKDINMKRSAIIVLLFSMAFSVMGNNEWYDEYRKSIKAKIGVELYIPESVPLELLETDLTFGRMSDDVFTLPLLQTGLVVRLTDDCSVIMPSADSMRRLGENQVYDVPLVASWMLANCNTVPVMWYIKNVHGVTMDGKKRSAKDVAELQERFERLMGEHVTSIQRSYLNDKSNSDIISIAELPDKKLVMQLDEAVGAGDDFVRNELFDKVKSGSVRCYGVEFYNSTERAYMELIFFIKGDAVIGDCVSKMADYIKFEKGGI